MQLYFTHTNPKQAANYLASHYPHKVGHTIKEGMQILGSVAYRYNTEKPLTISGKEYGKGYKDHPITKWAGDNQKNFEWVWQYLMYLGKKHQTKLFMEDFLNDKLDESYGERFIMLIHSIINNDEIEDIIEHILTDDIIYSHKSLKNDYADNLEITWNTYYELPLAKRRQPFPNCAKADGKKDFTHIQPTTKAYQLYLASQIK